MERIDNDKQYDASTGKAAFERMGPLLAELKSDQVSRVNRDLQDVSLVVLGVVDLVTRSEIRAKLTSIPGDIFEKKHLEILADIAHATIYCQVESMSASASDTDAKLPVSLVNRGVDVKDRMLKVCGYYLEDDPEDGPEVASIRSGTGYMDLASDLSRLVNLYNDNKTVIENDPKFYREQDINEAKSVSNEIVKSLSDAEDSALAKWNDLKARAWTLMRQSYDEVRATGRYIYRNDPSMKNKFPSLFAKR